MQLEVRIAGIPVTLTDENTWVCLFTEAPSYDHLYVTDPKTFVVFECRELLTQLLELGFPMQVRPLPTPWDESAFDDYIAIKVSELDHELDELEEP